MISWIKKIISAKVVRKVASTVVKSAIVYGVAAAAAWGIPAEVLEPLSEAAPQVANYVAELAVAIYLVIAGGSSLKKKLKK